MHQEIHMTQNSKKMSYIGIDGIKRGFQNNEL